MRYRCFSSLLAGWLALPVLAQFGTYVDPQVLDACPGYELTNVETSGSGLKADLILASAPCNVFGDDIRQLSLTVTYETGK